jgi:hypothetical protein
MRLNEYLRTRFSMVPADRRFLFTDSAECFAYMGRRYAVDIRTIGVATTGNPRNVELAVAELCQSIIMHRVHAVFPIRGSDEENLRALVNILPRQPC